MPSQQRFEGPELEELLDDVRDRFGPDVVIAEANKIRKGGVGGFFARELFEVVVEVDDPTDAAPAGPSLMDLVDAVDDGPEPQPHEGQRTDVERDGELASAETVEELLEKLDETRARGTAPAPQHRATVSTDGDAFAEVLGRIARSAQQAPATGTDDAEEDAPFRSFADEARRVPVAQGATPAPSRSAAQSPTAAPSAEAPTPAATAAPAPARDRRPKTVTTTSPRNLLDRSSLARLGLSGPLLERPLSATDRVSALLELAETFPRAEQLPDGADTVIALVGGDAAAMEQTVSWVHEQLGLVPERLMLATAAEQRFFPEERRIHDRDRASELRRSWRRRSQPVVVAVDSPIARSQTTWARHLLDALEPSAVWAVVDARHKPEDVVEWAERIGGIDAIALDGTEETTSPAAMVGTGLPVSLVDGHLATPARWAAILDERLLAA